MDRVSVKILDPRLGTQFPLPDYATPGAAGMDLRAMPEQDTALTPGETRLIPTGLALYLQDAGFCAAVFPRSGLGWRHGIVLGNLTGIIDADYQGPLLLPLWNRGHAPFVLSVGLRVAQLVFLPIARPSLQVVTDFPPSARGERGFGSTGNR